MSLNIAMLVARLEETRDEHVRGIVQAQPTDRSAEWLLGRAAGHWEAIDTVRRIIDEMLSERERADADL